MVSDAPCAGPVSPRCGFQPPPSRLQPPVRRPRPRRPQWKTSGTSLLSSSGLGPWSSTTPTLLIWSLIRIIHSGSIFRRYLGVEAGVHRVLWQIRLRQPHLLQNIHFFLDQRPVKSVNMQDYISAEDLETPPSSPHIVHTRGDRQQIL